MLRNEVGWFDEEDNSPDTLSMRLANDATFVRAAFSNRLSIFIQDSFAVIVAILIGLLLGWRLALVALATLPILTLSAIAQVCFVSSVFPSKALCYGQEDRLKLFSYVFWLSNSGLVVACFPLSTCVFEFLQKVSSFGCEFFCLMSFLSSPLHALSLEVFVCSA